MIIRIKKTENYTVIHNQCLRNPNISARAKGIFCYLMSLPNNWKIKRNEIVNHFTEGRDSISSSFQELEKNGYIVKERVKNPKNGKFIGWEYFVYELAKPVKSNLTDILENRNTENQPLGNPPLLSTKEVSTKEKLNTNKEYTDVGTSAVKLIDENDIDVPIEAENILRKCITLGKFTDHIKYKYKNKKALIYSATYSNIIKALIQINLGTFLNKRPIDPEWIKNQKILKFPAKEGYNEWFKVEKILLKSVEKASAARKTKKEYVPNNFFEYLYNPETKKSRFLYFLNNEGMVGDDLKIKGLKKYISNYANEMIDRFITKTNLSGNKLLQFWSNMALLNSWYKKNSAKLMEYNKEHHDNGFGYHCGNVEEFFKMALFYLENETGGYLPPRPLPPEKTNELWLKFRSYLLNSFDIEIEPDI